MFYGCTSLSNIKPLEKWNVSNCTNFSNMFNGCTSLCDINSLENWDVSNSNSFSYMFYGCSSLSNIKSLEKWNVSKCKNFSYIFHGLNRLTDISPLGKWKSSNEVELNDKPSSSDFKIISIDFSSMFAYCSSLSNINGIEAWNVYSVTNFNYFFRNCTSLYDIKALEK